MPQPEPELALQLHQVGALALDLGPLDTQDLVERLGLQTAAGHGEVDEGDSAADIGRELDRRVTRREEHGE